MIKRILVPLDPSDYSTAALKYACAIAKPQQAELTGLVILDTEGIDERIELIKPYQYDYSEFLDRSMREDARIRIRGLLEQFRKSCNSEGVAHREAERQGSPSRHIVQSGMTYDLIVMGLQTHYNFETSPRAGNDLSIVLDHSTAPILAVPNLVKEGDMQRVVITYNGTRPAARALQHFAQLAIVPGAEVSLVMSHDDADEAEHHLRQAEDYLVAHGIDVVTREWTPQDIITAVEERHLADADLVVLGAHSKHGVIDFMFGSLGRHLIGKARVPLLIGQ